MFELAEKQGPRGHEGRGTGAEECNADRRGQAAPTHPPLRQGSLATVVLEPEGKLLEDRHESSPQGRAAELVDQHAALRWRTGGRTPADPASPAGGQCWEADWVEEVG